MTRFERVYEINDSFLDVIRDEQAWFIGLMAADGCVHDRRAFKLSQSGEHGRMLIEHARRLLSYTGPIYRYRDKVHSITITSPRLVTSLAMYGVIPRKSLTLRFPSNLPPERHAAFIRGYIDGDGCVGVYHSGTTEYLLISFVGTAEFMSDCAAVLPHVGKLRRIERVANLVEMRITGQKAVELGSWLWSNRDLPKYKQAAWEEFVSSHNPRWLVYASKKARALDMLANGSRVSEVSRALGISESCVYTWRSNAGI